MKDTEHWKENKTIGDIAEKVVKFLMEGTGEWNCINFGVENHIEDLRKNLKNNLTNSSRRVRSMPDFIAVNKKTQEVILIDVKYRSFIDRREKDTLLFGFGYGQMKDYLDFWGDAKLIVVHNHEPYFYVIDLKKVEWHKHFHSRQYIDDRTLFEQWNFVDINHPITHLLPNLTEDKIKTAISMIPQKITD